MNINFIILTISIMIHSAAYCGGPQTLLDNEADVYMRRIYAHLPIDEISIKDSLQFIHFEDDQSKSYTEVDFFDKFVEEKKHLHEQDINLFLTTCRKIFNDSDHKNRSVIYKFSEKVVEKYVKIIQEHQLRHQKKTNAKKRKQPVCINLDDFDESFKVKHYKK